MNGRFEIADIKSSLWYSTEAVSGTQDAIKKSPEKDSQGNCRKHYGGSCPAAAVTYSWRQQPSQVGAGMPPGHLH